MEHGVTEEGGGVDGGKDVSRTLRPPMIRPQHTNNIAYKHHAVVINITNDETSIDILCAVGYQGEMDYQSRDRLSLPSTPCGLWLHTTATIES